MFRGSRFQSSVRRINARPIVSFLFALASFLGYTRIVMLSRSRG
jgi:hypothetical protein